MNARLRTALKAFGVLLVAALIGLFWYSGRSNQATVPGGAASATERGEEVYASHDCTDCHLAPHILKAKRAKGEPGLIRVRKDANELMLFLQNDKRHETFVLISEADRADLIAYLKSLQ